MPYTSKKSEWIDSIYDIGILEIMQNNEFHDNETDEILSIVLVAAAQAESCSFGEILRVPKQSFWLEQVLPSYDEGRFKQALRVTHQSFDKLLRLIQDDPIFFHPQHLQFPVSVQLAVALYRFGNSGTAASSNNVAMLFGVGDGSTLTRITRRVISAVLSLKEKFVCWPNESERSSMMQEMQEILPGVILWVDGTHVKLEQAPVLDKESYFDKNKNYSLQIQIICDSRRVIRHYICGYPGSVHDSRVWNESDIKNAPQKYFSPGQIIGADKGYPLSTVTVTPYRENTKEVARIKLKTFNKYFSRLRVVTEHVNGMLKEIFASLKELRVLIKDANSHRQATEWVETCMIIYNIIMPQIQEIPILDCPENELEEIEFNCNEELPEESERGREQRLTLLDWVMAQK